jgi:hypothetical protein
VICLRRAKKFAYYRVADIKISSKETPEVNKAVKKDYLEK